MSAHDNCTGFTKYRCDYEEQLDQLTMEFDLDGSGNVEAPTGWFTHITLSEDEAAERILIEHFDGKHFVIQTNDFGQVFLNQYATEELMMDTYNKLEKEFEEWLTNEYR